MAGGSCAAIALTALAWSALPLRATAGGIMAVLKDGREAWLVGCGSRSTESGAGKDELLWRYDSGATGTHRVRGCASDGSASVGISIAKSSDRPVAASTCRGCEWCEVPLVKGTEYVVSAHVGSLASSYEFAIECPEASAAGGDADKASKQKLHRSEQGRVARVPASCAGKELTVRLNKRRWDARHPATGLGSVIPHKVFMTYYNRSKIPRKVFAGVMRHAPRYALTVYDDTRCLRYLRRFYGPDLARRFACTSNGAHKADLWRYAMLYERGGVYVDVKTVLVRPLREVFTDAERAYTVLSTVGSTVYQGILATPPRNPLIWEMLQRVLDVTPEAHSQRYDLATSQAFTVLQENGVPMVPGSHDVGKSDRPGWVLFRERCVEAPSAGCEGPNCVTDVLCVDPDRYGYCCTITGADGAVFKTRYSDYPW